LRDPAGRLDATVAAAALLALCGRAERALGRPVTHAVIAIAGPLDGALRAAVSEAALASGLVVTRILAASEAAGLAGGTAPAEAVAHGAAIAAEDDALLAARRG
jgi:hypothetical protein